MKKLPLTIKNHEAVEFVEKDGALYNVTLKAGWLFPNGDHRMSFKGAKGFNENAPESMKCKDGIVTPEPDELRVRRHKMEADRHAGAKPIQDAPVSRQVRRAMERRSAKVNARVMSGWKPRSKRNRMERTQ